jgi:hypothetical protein
MSDPHLRYLAALEHLRERDRQRSEARRIAAETEAGHMAPAVARVLLLALPLALGGCGGLPMALSSAAGALTVAKDVFDLDVSVHQATPGKVPLAQALRPPPAVSGPVVPNP